MAEKCCAKVFDAGFWPKGHQCHNTAVVERDFKRYCRIHDPEEIAKRQVAQSTKWDNRMKRIRLEATASMACRLVNLDNPIAVAKSITMMYQTLKVVEADGTISKVSRLAVEKALAAAEEKVK